MAPRIVSSAIKCFELLDLLAEYARPASVTELSERLGALRGTTHQQLQTLVAAGWAEQLPNLRYRLTLRSLVVGNRALEQANLGARLRPALSRLADRTHEGASLAILQGGQVLIAARADAPSEFRIDFRPGSSLPLTKSSSGRVILAHATHTELESLRVHHPDIPSDRELQKIRHRGWADQLNAYIQGMSSLAVPVTNTALGTAGLAVTVLSSRYSRRNLLPELRQSAAQIESLMANRD